MKFFIFYGITYQSTFAVLAKPFEETRTKNVAFDSFPTFQSHNLQMNRFDFQCVYIEHPLADQAQNTAQKR